MEDPIALILFAVWEKEDAKPQEITYSLDLMTKIVFFFFFFIIETKYEHIFFNNKKYRFFMLECYNKKILCWKNIKHHGKAVKKIIKEFNFNSFYMIINYVFKKINKIKTIK